MFFHKSLHINNSERLPLATIGISEFQDFINYSSGTLVSRPFKRHVRTLYLDVAGQKKKYFLKQTGRQSFKSVFKAWCRLQSPLSDTAREQLLLELFRAHEIPVMKHVAWGDCRVCGWSVASFILVEEVVGKEFVEVYREASIRTRRRLMWIHGELMGILHKKGIDSKVHPRDLICISQNYTSFQNSVVVIDRERGRTYQEHISLKHRGKTLAEIWVKGAFTLGRGERSELLAFLSGYLGAAGMQRLNKAMRQDLVNWIFCRVEHILDSDQRFFSLRQDFKEAYGIPRT